MYRNFYKLNELPFNVTPDPNFFFFSRRHKEALTHLLYGIKERKGFLQITGEIGTGKTTMCRMLLRRLNEKTKTAFIFNPYLTHTQLLTSIVQDLGIAVKTKNRSALLGALNNFLLEQLSLGCNVVLILDEAQGLRPSLLEHIRLLSNLETDKEKLFQIVLVGQPELHQKLLSPKLRQLRQRITIRYHILPLERAEIGNYIEHRLKVSGSSGEIAFTPEASEQVYEYSKGIPRLINVVCDRALLLGYVKETWTVTGQIIEKCIKEIDGG